MGSWPIVESVCAAISCRDTASKSRGPRGGGLSTSWRWCNGRRRRWSSTSSSGRRFYSRGKSAKYNTIPTGLAIAARTTESHPRTRRIPWSWDPCTCQKTPVPTWPDKRKYIEPTLHKFDHKSFSVPFFSTFMSPSLSLNIVTMQKEEMFAHMRSPAAPSIVK